MKQYANVSQIVTVVEKTTCDICGNVFDPAAHVSGYFEEVHFWHRRGDEYSEGGSGDELDLDICPDCMNNIIVPFLKSVGKTVEYKEWYR